MTEVNKGKRCCGCGKNKKELSIEELDKVTGGKGQENLINLCDDLYPELGFCDDRRKVEGKGYFCVCVGKTNGKCCKKYGCNSTCVECSDYDNK